MFAFNNHLAAYQIYSYKIAMTDGEIQKRRKLEKNPTIFRQLKNEDKNNFI